MPSAKTNPRDATTPLPPGRAALALAIEGLWECQRRFDKAREPLGELERIRAVSVSREAAELREAIDRLHAAHAADIAAWIAAGAGGERPAVDGDVLEAERRLGQIDTEARAASVTASIAEEGAAGAAENMRLATRERDAAVWPAAVEASQPLFDEMRHILSKAATLESRLRGLVQVLRRAGDRDPSGRTGGYRAAEVIERRLMELHSFPRVQPDLAPGEALLQGLRTDPAAAL